MKQFYLTLENHPIKTNNPSEPLTLILEKNNKENYKQWYRRCEQEYKKICKERNQEIEEEKN